MSNKLKVDFQELNKILVNKKIKFEDGQVYNGSLKKYNLVCLECGYKWESIYNNIIYNGSGCSNCAGNKRIEFNTKETNLKIRDRNFEVLSNQEYKFKNVHSILKWHCFVCNEIWETSYNKIINGDTTNCPKCGIIKSSNTRRNNFNTDITNEKVKDRNFELLPNQEFKYENAHCKLFWHCFICENIWEASYSNVIYNNGSCPKCVLENRSGENSNFWRGGRFHSDYSPEWYTGKIQKIIRDRDSHICQYPECEYDDRKEKRKLYVHHIDGDKKNCAAYNLISLCMKHHATVEGNNPRSWEEYFYTITESYNLKNMTVKLTIDSREFIFNYVEGDFYSIISYIGSSGKTETLFYTREELEQMGKLEDMENDIEET